MYLLDNAVVSKALSRIDECVKIVDEAYLEWAAGNANSIPITAFLSPTSNRERFYQFGAMCGGSRKWKMFCIRMLDDIVRMRSYGTTLTREKYCMKPGTYCGFLLLFSTESAEPLAIINDGVIQHVSVGVSAGVLVRHISKAGSDTVGVLGAGGMARTFLEASHAVRKIRKVKVYSPTKAHRKKYSIEMAERLGIEVNAVDNPREAVRGTDIVLCCTDALKPVMFGKWLEPGMYVCSVQGEVDASLIKRVDLNVGLSNDMLVPTVGRNTISYGPWQNVRAYHVGKNEEFALLPQYRGVARTRHYTTLADIITGRHEGRKDDKQTAYSHAAGTNDSVRFVALAAHAYSYSKKKGLGTEIPTDWLLENIRD